MADDEYQANWRGARRYQFDEELRRKRAALAKQEATIHQMRFVKWADPQEKLKVLAEDIHDSRKLGPWIDQRQAGPDTEEKAKIIPMETAELTQCLNTLLDGIPPGLFWILICAAGLIAFSAALAFA